MSATRKRRRLGPSVHVSGQGDVAAVAMRERDAATYIALTPSFLRAARAGRGEGPPFARLGRAIVYLRSDLDAWLQSRRVNGGARG